VRALQRRLNAVLGGADIPVNGHYSSATRAKVAEFQRRQGWRGSDADGLIYPGGRETTKRLFVPGSGYRIIWG
jgi:peptidoglycan hydrolase-like protein with peptidoglycan-binding domain